MKVNKAASDTLAILRLHNAPLQIASRHDNIFMNSGLYKKENTLAHAYWMLTLIAHGDIVDEKAHRWLGWAQALLSCHNVTTLETLKAINKNSCDKEHNKTP